MQYVNEGDLAAEFQATKDDPNEWGDAAPAPTSGARSEKRRLAAMVSVRLAPDELTALQEHARRKDTTVSGYLRALALADITELTSTREHEPEDGFAVIINSGQAVQYASTSPFVFNCVEPSEPDHVAMTVSPFVGLARSN